MELDYFLVWCYVLMSYLSLYFLQKVVVQVWLTPRRIEDHYMKQGIKGPKYQILLGNLKELATLNFMASTQPLLPLSHNILPRVLSFYHHWKKLYGSMFIVWFGTTPRLTISDPALVRQVLVDKAELFEKNESPTLLRELEGDGLLSLKGEKWAHHRKIIQPMFHVENLKMMIPIMGKDMEAAVEKWWEEIGRNGGKMEVEVSELYQNLVEDVIARATFGGCSYAQYGRPIFQLQAQQMVHATHAYNQLFIPGYRLLPTKEKRISGRLEKEVRKSLVKLIDRRIRNNATFQDQCPKDLLGLMTGCSAPAAPTVNDIVEECKTIFFAGKHTTLQLLTWTTVLLAMHPRWQHLARDEVLSLCGSRDTPTQNHLPKLKILSMILNESLRLYPPAVAMIRRAKTDVHLGGLHVLRGTELLIPILAVHHDPAMWGHDAQEFNPMRFDKGVAQAAKSPMAFLPFGFGARRCIGQNLAILQAKLAIAIILQRFSFELTPDYRHAPAVLMLLHPQHGAPMVFRKL
ncbi:cytochrome P450 734A1-like [Henckelia pumila]|uniref:cytochrome P450 734A1-like n=1 Tax=Henckelia pumila TaxID=405737 RepID=UPI003C6DF8E9